MILSRNVLWIACIMSCMALSLHADNLARIYPGSTPEYYNSVSTSGLGSIASGNVLTQSGGQVFAADFDDNGYDEILQITAGSEYYVAPVVNGIYLEGTQYTASSFASDSGVYATGKFLAGDSRDYLMQIQKGSPVEYLRQIAADGTGTTIGTGNLDQYSVMSGSVAKYLVGDYNGDGTDEMYVIWGGTDFAITDITINDGVMSSTDYINSTGMSAESGNYYVSGYFVENSGRDQFLRMLNSDIAGGQDDLWGLCDDSGWLSGSEQLGMNAGLIPSLDGTEDLVVGDFDNDGFDELLVVRTSSSDWLYDDFSVTGGSLTATQYIIDAGSPTAVNYAVNFIPEPSTIALLLTGLASSLIRRRKI